jgi:hypothetical protein
MKAYWGVAVYLHAFLTSVLDLSGQLYPQGKISLYSSDRRLDGPQSRCGCSGKETPSLPQSGSGAGSPARID